MPLKTNHLGNFSNWATFILLAYGQLAPPLSHCTRPISLVELVVSLVQHPPHYWLANSTGTREQLTRHSAPALTPSDPPQSAPSVAPPPPPPPPHIIITSFCLNVHCHHFQEHHL